YNGDGTLSYKTDQKQQQTQYTYTYIDPNTGLLTLDPLGRVRGTDYTAPTSPVPLPCRHVTRNYAGFSSGLGFSNVQWQWGRLTSAQWSDTTCAYTFQQYYIYDKAGQVTQKRLSMPSATNVNIDGFFGYDQEGRLTGYQTSMNATQTDSSYN